MSCELHLVVDDGHVEIAQLLEGVCKIGMCLCHLRVQQYATVIEGNALLVVPQLVVNGANQQQQIRPVCMHRVYLQQHESDL
jgi:hypothetical protein